MGPPPREMLIHILNEDPGEMRDPAQPRAEPMGKADKVHGCVKPLNSPAIGTLSVRVGKRIPNSDCCVGSRGECR